jgi:hypothetical protein
VEVGYFVRGNIQEAATASTCASVVGVLLPVAWCLADPKIDERE